MNLVFVINSIESEVVKGTTPLMMWKAHQRGHDVLVMGVGNFSFHHQLKSGIDCLYLPNNKKPKSVEELLEAFKTEPKEKKLYAKDIDVLLLRNNPTEEASGRVWAEHAGVAFARMLQQEGVLVLNDAFSLSKAFIDKLYFEQLPDEIKPKSIISRNKKEILEFYEANNKNIVLKPLEGSGGQNVFHMDENEPNTNQIIDTIRQDGYIIAQEFLPEVSKGDIRVIMMNGRILEEDGEKAMIRRVAGKGEFRSNFALGAHAEKAKYSDKIEKIIELTAPSLVRDGMFLVGLDIVDDRLIEVNLLSPGGLEHMGEIKLPDFTTPIIEAIERKLLYKTTYSGQMSNKLLATMI